MFEMIEKKLAKKTMRPLTEGEIEAVSGAGGDGGAYTLSTCKSEPREGPNGIVMILTIIDD
ncbi:MAG: hypothetical protein AAFX09_00690 [Pseudomonadota bacterium]